MKTPSNFRKDVSTAAAGGEAAQRQPAPGRVGILPAQSGVSPDWSELAGACFVPGACPTFESSGRDARRGGQDAHPTRDHCAAARWESTRDACSTLARFARGGLGGAVLALVLICGGSGARAQETDALTRERDEQTGTAITILFDNSGSMREENKIAQAKSAFRTWLQTVPADYKFSLITFEETGRLVVPLGEKTRDLVAQKVARLQAETGTPICGALRIARQQIEKRRREVTPYERHVVLVFTDGQETADPRGINGVREDITALRKQTVEVVGIGFHGQGDYMDGVATRFALAGNEAELRRGLAKVDAEIGGVDDLVVSPADLTALKSFNAPAVRAVSAVAADATADVAPAPAAAGRKSSFNVTWIVLAIIVWVAVRTVSNSKKRSR